MGEFLSKMGNAIEDIADVLQTTYPEQRGFSSRIREKEIKVAQYTF
jgi:hypothetical protein